MGIKNAERDRSLFYVAAVCFGLIVIAIVIFLRVTLGKEEGQKQREISVILYSAGTGGWESLLEGAKRAEDDFSVNINFVTLREDATTQECFASIEREVAGGAEGIVLAVPDYENLYKLWLGKKFSIPIVTVESGFDESTITHIAADDYEMGRLLAEEILEDYEKQPQLIVGLVRDEVSRESVREREKGFLETLEGKAKIMDMKDLEGYFLPDAAVALHKEALLKLAEDTTSMMAYVPKYGIGSTAAAVALLDQGRIEKLVFQNEFNMGYLAVEALLEEIDNESHKHSQHIDYYCVDAVTLYESPYEKLLFPIVE